MKTAAVVVLCLSVAWVDSQCQLESKTYICELIPQSYPAGLSSLLFTVKNVGEINSSVFHSESLASVTRFIFRGAGITNISAGALSPFSNLTNLVLDNNILSSFTPTWFSRPERLSLLSLPGNHIAVLEASMLNPLTGLTSLDLARNKIKTIAPGSFAFQPQLSSLNLSRNLLTHVDPKVFLPLNSTRIHLDGNPWSCSCEAEDFIIFVRDLQRSSLLEREMEVRCESPAHRRGQLVWNVSRCVTPTDDPVTSTVIPLTTKKPATIPPSVTIPALIAIIVVLCVLLCVVCALAGAFVRRRTRRQVRPQPEVKEEEGGPESLNPLRQPYQKCPEEMANWGLECVQRVPGTEVRTKSANAVLYTSPLCGAGRRPHKMETEREGPLSKPTSTEGNNTREQGEQLGEEDSRNSTAQDVDEKLQAQKHLTDFINEETRYPDRDVSPLTNNKATKDTETIPYLSIGTDLTTPKNGRPKDLNEESRGPGIQTEQVIGRVSTWPPSSSQWKARCANQGEGLSSSIVPGPFQDEVVNRNVLSEGGALVVMAPVPDDIRSPGGGRGGGDVVEPSGDVEASGQESSEESTDEPLKINLEAAALNYDPDSENVVMSTPDTTEPPAGPAKQQSEPANSAEFPTGPAELLADRPYSTEPLTGSAELQSEPLYSTEPLTGSAELQSEPLYSTEPLTGSAELRSEPLYSTEPLTGSAELQSEPLYSTEPLTGSAELQSEPLYSTEPLTGSAELQSEPLYSTEPLTGSAELQSEPLYSTEPLTGSSELQSEPPLSTELPSGSAELLSKPLSTEPLNGSSELQSEPPNSTEPLTGSAELQSEPPSSTEPLTPVAELQTEPPGSSEPSAERRQSQLCLVSFETASTESDSPEDGSQSTEPQTDPVTEPSSGETQNQSQTGVRKAEELLTTHEANTGQAERGGKQRTAGTHTEEKPKIQGLGGSSQSPPTGGSPNDESLLVNNEYAVFGLLQEVVENRGRWTRERWRQTHKNQQLYRRKAQGH